MRHIVMLPSCLYHIFPHHLIKATTFGRKLLITKSVFLIVSAIFVCKSLILRLIRRDVTINVHRSSCRAPATLLTL